MSSNAISDPEVLAFIARTKDLYPDDAVDLTIAEQRAVYDRMAAAFRQPRPTGISALNLTISGSEDRLVMREYRSEVVPMATLLYLHGGGFVVGGLDSHDDVCAEIADRCHLRVVSLDYRLCPEHPHPAAYLDTLAAVDHLSGERLIVAGDSAGANLAAAASLARREAIAGQVLIYPGRGGEGLGLHSYTEHAEAPMLTTAKVRAYATLRTQGAAQDAVTAPLHATDLSGAPRCFISAAEVDPLRDDGIEYHRRLREAGVMAELSVEDELPHGYLRARSLASRAATAFDRVIGAISRMARG